MPRLTEKVPDRVTAQYRGREVLTPLTFQRFDNGKRIKTRCPEGQPGERND